MIANKEHEKIQVGLCKAHSKKGKPCKFKAKYGLLCPTHSRNLELAVNGGLLAESKYVRNHLSRMTENSILVSLDAWLSRDN